MKTHQVTFELNERQYAAFLDFANANALTKEKCATRCVRAHINGYLATKPRRGHDRGTRTITVTA